MKRSCGYSSGGGSMPRLRVVTFFTMLLTGAATAFAEPTALVVEFYNADLGRYFVTADPNEAATLDNGRTWVRTGGQFSAWSGADDAAGLQPVCRFYVPSARSHFFSIDASECDDARANGWADEGIAFFMTPPEAGSCDGGTASVYMASKALARGAENRRLTVDYTAWANSSAQGFAPRSIAMCAPLSTSERRADAMRLLRQATFGPTEGDVQRVLAVGPEAWVAEQLAAKPTAYPDYPWVATNRPQTCIDDRTLPIRPDSFCARDNYTLFP